MDQSTRIIESNGEGVVPVHYRPVEMTFAHLPTDDRLLEVQKYNSLVKNSIFYISHF